MIFVDIETDNLNPYSVTKISCMVTFAEGYQYWHDSDQVLPRDGSIADGITFLNMRGDTLVGHNIQLYDFPVLKRFGLNDLPLLDTLLISRLLFPLGKKEATHYIHPDTVENKDEFIKQAQKKKYDDAEEEEQDVQYFVSHGLEKWGQRLGIYKQDVDKDFTTVRGELLEYCKRDVVITQRLFQHSLDFIATLDDSQYELYKQLADFNSRVASATRNMCANGVHIDEGSLTELLKEITEVIEGVKQELFAAFKPEYVTLVHKPIKKNPDRIVPVIAEFNPGSDLMLARAIFEKYPEFVPTAYTETGRPSFKLANIEPLFGTYPELRLVSYYRDLVKRKSAIEGDGVSLSGKGYLNNLMGGRLHGTINSLGARTWRATHSLPNLGQTTSKKKSYGVDIRRAFIAPAGFKFVGFDISNLEVGTIAEMVHRVTGHATLMNQVLRGRKEDGTDTHSLNAKSLTREFNQDIDRDTAKTLFFAFLYGAGAAKLGTYMYGGKDSDARIEAGRKVIRVFGRTCPGLIETREYFIVEYLLNGFVTLPDGHRVVANSPHACLNMIGQGLGALISKYILVGIHEVITKSGFCPKTQVMPVLWVHDEMHFQVREDLADEFISIIPETCKKACESLELTFPIEVETAMGTSWADTH